MIHKISWLGEDGKTINPLKVKNGGYHCTKCSPGCAHCYAEGINNRFGNGIPYDNRPVEFELDLSVFDNLPKHKSVRVFVESMGDLFHEQVSDWMIYEILRKIEECPRHRFLILTKRTERMQDWFHKRTGSIENLALGVTVCNQAEADEKIPLLLQTPAAMRFVSLEPLLEDVDLTHDLDGYRGEDKPRANRIDWVITGGESGPGARPSHSDWFRSVRDQCAEASVPYFHKQNGEWTTEFPQGLNLTNRAETFDHNTHFYRIGKKLAGHLLDGVEHHAFPEGW